MDLLNSLIVVSEKAANIARLCRQNEHLFHLLIEQKKSEEANPRFVQDFKTLADVLIQEMVKHDIGNLFPDLKNSIHGEENNTFSNKLGETIKVEIKQTNDETADLLKIVLNEDEQAAQLLAEEVHRSISLDEVNSANPNNQKPVDPTIDLKELGIWIDPIDSTAEYINGVEQTHDGKIFTSGLKCVTVLLGVFHKTTGLPIMGVVNQPFAIPRENPTGFTGRCFWGFPDLYPTSDFENNSTICISGSEDSSITEKLKAAGFRLVEASGAGYKILTVIQGYADAYILSKDSTFKWDTCGPQAILRAMGGDICVLKELVDGGVKGTSVLYGDHDKTCNRGGIVAYRDLSVLDNIIKALQ